jgi:fructose-bisphosphate aldolase class II
MPWVDMHDLLNHAYRNRYAVGSFSAANLDCIEAVLAAAEHARSPVILNLSDSRRGYSDFELVAAAAERAAKRATVPVALLFERGGTHESIVRAINCGCNGVRAAAAHESFPANVANTRRLAETAHACGVMVEGELGRTGGDGEATEGSYTAVEEARAFVQRTGVDSLAVSIGCGNGRTRGRLKLDVDRLKRINEAVHVPLAIHVDSSLAGEQCHKLMQHGVARVSYDAFPEEFVSDCLRTSVRKDSRVGFGALAQDVRAAIQAEVERCLHRWGSAGRAAEVQVQCRVWQPVQHVIVYNVESARDEQVEVMMARGHDVLSRIPGVRRVFTGWAVQEEPPYRFCWLIEFAHEKVIDSYRHHPDHVAFANQLFRPIAGDRISIDFSEMTGSSNTAVLGGHYLARKSLAG